MKSWNVYSSGKTDLAADTLVATAYEIEYHGEHMGEVYLSATFNSDRPLKFSIGDYIEYRGERFYLSVVPACKQQASNGSYGQAFVYENVKFNSVVNELATCDFLDVVLSDNKIHWTALSTFSFQCDNVSDLGDRIQANLDRVYGEGVWDVNVGECENQSEEITIDKQTIWDALSLVDTTFHKNFLVRGRRIFIVPEEDNTISHVFKVGIGNGLVSLDRTVDDSQKVVTRLRAYGNTTNIPTSYYKYVTMKGKVELSVEDKTNSVRSREPVGIKEYGGFYVVTTIVISPEVWAGNPAAYSRLGDKSILVYEKYNNFSATLDKESAHPKITIYFGDDESGYQSVEAYVYYYINTEEKKIVAWEILEYNGPELAKDPFYRWIKNKHDLNGSLTENVIMQSDNSDIINFSYLINYYGDDVTSDIFPNNMAVTRLMLPEFPSLNDTEKDLKYIDEAYKGYKLVLSGSDVYIDSPNVGKYGIIEGSLYVDGTDNEYTKEDIYPSIKEYTADDLINAGYNIVIGNGVDRRLDRIATDCVAVSGKLDNGDPDIAKDGGQCYVCIKDIGFDINNYMIGGQTPVIHMMSGECVGREFDIASVFRQASSTTGYYRLTINRKYDDNLKIYYPNKDQNIKAGDEFAILNIRMPKVFYDTASQRLLKEALKWFIHNDETRFAYTPTIDNLWIAREDREARKKYGENASSIYKTIQAGDLMMIESDDLGIGASVRISSLTIKENSQSPIPEFDIQLQDKKSVGAIQRIQNKLEDYTNSGGGGLSYDQVKTVISDSGSYKFISKRDDDFAEGQITMEKGLIAQSSHDGKETAADGLIEYYTEEES